MIKSTQQYTSYLTQKGLPLDEINPGSDEIALHIDDSFKAINLIKLSLSAVLGGDILIRDKETEKMEYAYSNWASNQKKHESWLEYCERSYRESEKYLKRFSRPTKNQKVDYYVVFCIRSKS